MPPPPEPDANCCSTPRHSATDTAASAALPPFDMMLAPICEQLALSGAECAGVSECPHRICTRVRARVRVRARASTSHLPLATAALGKVKVNATLGFTAGEPSPESLSQKSATPINTVATGDQHTAHARTIHQSVCRSSSLGRRSASSAYQAARRRHQGPASTRAAAKELCTRAPCCPAPHRAAHPTRNRGGMPLLKMWLLGMWLLMRANERINEMEAVT